MPQPQKFEARATLVDGKVSWELCHMNPPDPPRPWCGNTKATYPDIILEANAGKYDFEFAIKDNTGLGIKFANEPIWLQQGTKPPKAPGTHSQIQNPQVPNPQTLKFEDLNSEPNPTRPDPVVLKYRLNFVDQNGQLTSIDPDITNGGTNTKSWDFADYLLPVGASLLAGILLAILFRSLVLRKAW